MILIIPVFNAACNCFLSVLALVQILLLSFSQ